MTIHEFATELEAKTSWGTKELKALLQKVEPSVTTHLQNIERVRKTDLIKKYDVIYVQTMASVHYVLVHRVHEGIVYGIVMSSKEECHTLHKIEEDRYFKGNFMTKTYLCFPLEACQKSFVRKYESRKEADLIFRELKNYYKTVLK